MFELARGHRQHGMSAVGASHCEAVAMAIGGGGPATTSASGSTEEAQFSAG
jgi:hypothetical protein